MKCGSCTCLHTQITVMSTFLHDPSLQMGLNKMNYSEKNVGHLKTLDAIQTAKGNIKELEKRFEIVPQQAEGRASLRKMPRAWGRRTYRTAAAPCCYAQSCLNRYQQLYKRKWRGGMKPLCLLWGIALPNAGSTEAAFLERKLWEWPLVRQSLFLLKIGGLLTALPRLLRTFSDCSPLWS